MNDSAPMNTMENDELLTHLEMDVHHRNRWSDMEITESWWTISDERRRMRLAHLPADHVRSVLTDPKREVCEHLRDIQSHSTTVDATNESIQAAQDWLQGHVSWAQRLSVVLAGAAGIPDMHGAAPLASDPALQDAAVAVAIALPELVNVSFTQMRTASQQDVLKHRAEMQTIQLRAYAQTATMILVLLEKARIIRDR